MKKLIIILLLITHLFSCQEVVDVDLKTAQERLVIEALINWENGTTGNEQTIKLTKTSSFYNNQIIPATGAAVVIENIDSQEVFNFNETSNGIYQTTTFVPILNNAYKLQITYENESYKAISTLLPSPPIIEVTQSIEGGFSVDEPEVNISFQDFIGQDDYYRITFSQFRPSINQEIETSIYTYDSRFESDNVLSDYFESEDLLAGDSFDITIYSIPKPFFNFLEKLENQSEESDGPFSSPPINVKGNIVNTTNKAKYPYGYFNLHEVSKTSYIFN